MQEFYSGSQGKKDAIGTSKADQAGETSPFDLNDDTGHTTREDAVQTARGTATDDTLRDLAYNTGMTGVTNQLSQEISQQEVLSNLQLKDNL